MPTSNLSNEAVRVPVSFRYDALNPDFIKAMAMIAGYAAQKYGSTEQYTGSRLVENQSPINHIYEHLRQYQCAEKYDHFDGEVGWHLAAIAYNAMMEFYYHNKFGLRMNPIAEAAQTE